jgi:hypothetical protein
MDGDYCLSITNIISGCNLMLMSESKKNFSSVIFLNIHIHDTYPQHQNGKDNSILLDQDLSL